MTMREKFKVNSLLAVSYRSIGAAEESEQIMVGLI